MRNRAFIEIMYIFSKVEGEMDKLSVEEAGFLNCISVPGGAPRKVSTDSVLPSIEKVLCHTNTSMPILCAFTSFLTVSVCS